MAKILNDAASKVAVNELTEDEGRALFERACRQKLDVSAAEFLHAHDSGEYPQEWSERAIQDVEFLIPFVR